MLKPTFFSTQLKLKQMINRSKYQYIWPCLLNARDRMSRSADCAFPKIPFYRIIKRRIPEFRITPYMALFDEQFQRSVRKHTFCKTTRYTVVHGLHMQKRFKQQCGGVLGVSREKCHSSGNITHTETSESNSSALFAVN